MIEGIGGVFLFSNDTKRLVTWYRDCLGILAEGQDSECDSIYKSFEYRDIENPEIKRTIVWAIIPTKQDIKDKPRTGRINYLVKNLGEVLSHLKSKGVAIEKTAEDPYGNFAWVRDPDGNQIELWEPSESVWKSLICEAPRAVLHALPSRPHWQVLPPQSNSLACFSSLVHQAIFETALGVLT